MQASCASVRISSRSWLWLQMSSMGNDACPPLGLRAFRDGSSKKAFDLSTFIRFYAAYLDAQLEVYARTKYVPVNIPGADPPKLKCDPLSARRHCPHSLCLISTDTALWMGAQVRRRCMCAAWLPA